MEFLKKNQEEQEELKKQMQKALENSKRRFLCSIGKADPFWIDEEDEAFLKRYLEKDTFSSSSLTDYRSLRWKDSIATSRVNKVLEEHQNFDIGLYLDCTKAIYLTYSGKLEPNEKVYESMTYVLTHARSFKDSTQNIFNLKPNGSFKTEFGDLSMPLPDSIYMREITALIKDLQTGYDELNYMFLNANVTYLTLLILRRFVKSDAQFLDAFKRASIHKDYVKLCPYPLHNQLPSISERFNKCIHDLSLRDAALLAIHAFLTGSDDETKRVLQATCVQYIEWTGLHLPKLFFEVVKLYQLEESELWDALTYTCTVDSLLRLAEDYYQQYKMSKADPPLTVAWFPFCRAINGDYHRNLSAFLPSNYTICMILANLIDLNKGFDESFVRKSAWVQKAGPFNLTRPNNEGFLKVAKKLQKQFSVPRLV